MVWYKFYGVFRCYSVLADFLEGFMWLFMVFWKLFGFFQFFLDDLNGYINHPEAITI